jgi:CheY-like chemotaxis protein
MDKPLSGRSILVIEDEMLIIMMIEDMLTDLGCESIAVASKVGPAISLVNGQIFDVAMVDLKLDGTESYPIADALTERGVPYFFSTGNCLASVKDGYRNRDVLTKPFTLEQLSQMLSRSMLRQTNVVKLRH